VADEKEEVQPDAVAGVASEVDEAINALIGTKEPEPELPTEATPEVAPEEPEAESVLEAEEEPEVEEPEEPEERPALSDDLLERAVKAGIPLAEARQYPNAGLLSAACGRIEGRQKESDGGAQAAESDSSEDVLASIPDLDPEEFDEKLVAAVKGMKDLIRQQQETISSLRRDQSTDWFETRAGTVKNLINGDAQKRDALREKFDVLSAGYKAAGKKVSRESVFDEAATLVLGGDVQATKQHKKAEAARNRQGQFIARPAPTRVSPKSGDVLKDIATEVDEALARLR